MPGLNVPFALVIGVVFSLLVSSGVASSAQTEGFRYPLGDGLTEPQINRDFGVGGVGGHLGQDYAAGLGDPIHASYGGKVVYRFFDETDDWNDGWGNTVLIEHENPGLPGEKIYTHYSHLSEVYVALGDEIDQGQVIGTVGSTGDSGGPHLHFEIKSGPELGDGYTRYDFEGDAIRYDAMTYYRPTSFIQANRLPPVGSESGNKGTQRVSTGSTGQPEAEKASEKPGAASSPSEVVPYAVIVALVSFTAGLTLGRVGGSRRISPLRRAGV
ncbi:MAG: M23 family metallopeptidase [Candidatus Aquicultorales bacterium]